MLSPLKQNFIYGLLLTFFLFSCQGEDKKMKEEQLTLEEVEAQNQFDSVGVSIKGNLSFNQLSTSPNSVILTGLDRFRLVTIYKVRPKNDRNIQHYEASSYVETTNDEYVNDNDFHYFMPGFDIISGYNLVNVGHYDLESEKLSYLFTKPVLVNTLYFPGHKKDSLQGMPVLRNYFMVSVYDEDTNNDTLINKRDIRKFYHFDELNSKKTQVIPPNYSAIRSTYDANNDIMYIYTRKDTNKNGTPEKQEPIHVFWLRLNEPGEAKKLF